MPNPLKLITDTSHPDFREEDFPHFICSTCKQTKRFPAAPKLCTDCYEANLGAGLAEFGAKKKQIREDDEFFSQQE